MFRTFEEDPFFNFDRSFLSPFQRFDEGFRAALPYWDHNESNKSKSKSLEKSSGGKALERYNDNRYGFKNFDDMFPSHRDMMANFSGIENMMSQMNSMMSRMENEARNMQKNPPKGAQLFHSSNFYSYDSREGREPHMYQAHHNVRMVDDLKEEQKAVRDSRRNEEKVLMGRYYGDKGHIEERRRNTRTGDEDNSRQLVGLEDDDKVRDFDETWENKAREKFHYRPFGGSNVLRNEDYERRHRGSHEERRALPEPRGSSKKKQHHSKHH